MTTSPVLRPAARPNLRPFTRLSALCLAFASLACSSAFALTGTITGHASDAQANSDGTVTNQTITYGRIGADSGVRHSIVQVFEIPSAILNDPTQQFSAATYTIKLGQGSAMTVNADFYGLGYDDVTTVQAADFYEGALDSANSLLQDNLLTPSTPAYATVTNSGANLVNHLNACLAAARADNATSAYVFLRLNLDAYVWSGVYIAGMNEAGGASAPSLSYTTVTVPTWSQIPLGGGGFVTGLVGDASGNTLLARTDVGGLYKWNPIGIGGTWLHLSDKIVPTTNRWNTTRGLLNTMSAAIDPANSNNLYIAVGGNAAVSATNSGIYASADGGSNWSEITTGTITPNFVINGNGDRAAGERLAVDPNNPNLLWYGSESHGLMKGVKSGSTWTWSQIPSTSLPFGTAGCGVRFVVCDKDGANTITYAGVYDSAATGNIGGVYKSTDGVNWTLLSGIALTKPNRASIASDGTLYVTGSGAVFKMTRIGTATNITPGLTSYEYRGLAISPDGSVVSVANTSGGTCEIWRSASGGASGTWKTQGTASFNNWNSSTARIYASEPDGSPVIGYQWFGNVAALWINPTNVNELWACDFYGVQRTSQADRIGNTAVNTQPVWYRTIKSMEETVVFSVRNAPAGNRLVAGVADVGGFRYANNVTQGPFGAYSNGGGLNATNGKNVTSIDFSEGDSSRWVYAWATDNGAFGTGGVSTDGGNAWRRFGQLARRSIANSTTAGWEVFDLGTYLAKQRAKGVTTVTLVVAGGDPWWENTPSMSFGSSESANAPRLVVNGSTVLPILADTYVSRPSPTTNYGNSTALVIRNNYSNEGWSYIKFDLSGVATIADSRLELYRNSSANTSTLDVGVHIGASNTWIAGDGGTDNVPAGEMTYNNRAYTVTDSSSSNNPLNSQPDYRQGGVSLRGGRIAVSSTNPDNMVWLPIGQTARYSEDGGMTWTAATGAPASQIGGLYTNGGTLDKSGVNLTADRVNGYFYIGYYGGASHAIYRSTDGGKTWSALPSVSNGGTYNIFSPQISAAPYTAAYPSGGDVWVCDDSSYNNNAYPAGGLWRLNTAGTGWTKLTNIGRVSQVSFGKHPSGTGYTVYAHGESNPGGLRKLYRSDDYGTTWNAMADLPSNTPILSISGDRQNAGKVFIGTDGRGMFLGQ